MTVEITPQTSGAYRRSDGLWVFPRDEFATRRFDYEAGEHTLFAGPSQNGKTSLAFRLLREVATPELPAYVIVSKPRDPVTEREGRKLGYRLIREHPIKPTLKELYEGKPSGYLIWPKFGDMETDVANARHVSDQFLKQIYADGARNKKAILVLDDTYLKARVLQLDKEMTTIHAMAGAMDIGAWTFIQKATGAGETTLMAYGAAEHVFLFNEPDKRYRERYGEIGGVDPKLVERAVMQLKKYEALYIKRTGRHMCVVGK